MMKYQGNEDVITLEAAERALTEAYGDSDYDREAGCYSNGNWFSVDAVLNILAENAGY